MVIQRLRPNYYYMHNYCNYCFVMTNKYRQLRHKNSTVRYLTFVLYLNLARVHIFFIFLLGIERLLYSTIKIRISRADFIICVFVDTSEFDIYTVEKIFWFLRQLTPDSYYTIIFIGIKFLRLTQCLSCFLAPRKLGTTIDHCSTSRFGALNIWRP